MNALQNVEWWLKNNSNVKQISSPYSSQSVVSHLVVQICNKMYLEEQMPTKQKVLKQVLLTGTTSTLEGLYIYFFCKILFQTCPRESFFFVSIFLILRISLHKSNTTKEVELWPTANTKVSGQLQQFICLDPIFEMQTLHLTLHTSNSRGYSKSRQIGHIFLFPCRPSSPSVQKRRSLYKMSLGRFPRRSSEPDRRTLLSQIPN